MILLKNLGAALGRLFVYLGVIEFLFSTYFEIINKETMEQKRLYVVSSGEYQKWAQLVCPCGCNDMILS